MGGYSFSFRFICNLIFKCVLDVFVFYSYMYILKKKTIEASCGAGAQSVTVNVSDCGFDPHSSEM